MCRQARRRRTASSRGTRAAGARRPTARRPRSRSRASRSMSSLRTSTCSSAVTLMLAGARPARRGHRVAVRGRPRAAGRRSAAAPGFSRSSLRVARVLDPPALHHVGAVGQPERERRELLDQQHPDAGLGDRADRRDQALDDDRRQPQRQLVDDHEPRLRDERLREHDHLLLAARQRARLRAEPLLELGEQLERPRAAGLGLRAPTASRWRRGGCHRRSDRAAAAGPRARSPGRRGGSAPGGGRRAPARRA